MLNFGSWASYYERMKENRFSKEARLRSYDTLLYNFIKK